MGELRGTRRRLLKVLRPLHAIPVENGPIHPGTPDINFAGGWIECKWRRAWPKRPRTVVALPHFTDQQRRFLTRRWECDEYGAWLVLQVGREWLLFEGPVAARVVGHGRREDLVDAAECHWTAGLDDREFLNYFLFL